MGYGRKRGNARNRYRQFRTVSLGGLAADVQCALSTGTSIAACNSRGHRFSCRCKCRHPHSAGSGSQCTPHASPQYCGGDCPESTDGLRLWARVSGTRPGIGRSPAYHGQATLARWPISNPRLIRFSRQSNFWQPRWFLPRMEPFQERLGGRIALVADINISGNKFVTYNLHLESRANDELRLSQVQEVLSDAVRQDPRWPLVIAGDLNLDASKNSAAAAFASAGFQDAIAAHTPLRLRPATCLNRGARLIGLLFAGRYPSSLGRVHKQVKASDHYPISFSAQV